ncbi:MAG: M2 family metallopeptidase [Pirellulaceae bacterium]|nr:M2 family metallopeptidase [Pirellulaceae bacterium]
MQSSVTTTARDFLTNLNNEYQVRHTAKEDSFWTAYMGLSDNPEGAQAELSEKEIYLQRFLQNPETLRQVERYLGEEGRSLAEEEKVALTGWQETFRAHTIDSKEAQELNESIVAAEGKLARARATMSLGYVDLEGQFVEASSVKLGTMLRTEKEEALRKSAWEGLRRIEDHVLENGFLEIVKMRNRLGRMLGGEDYYDWQVKRTEGLSKREVFSLLDELKEQTYERATSSLRTLKSTSPWNMSFQISGDITAQQDPYFAFEKSLAVWGKSFAALGIDYRGATLVLDLLDRKGKYENGFMHGPVPAWNNKGQFQPARIHFTANAIPTMVGSGERALETFFHEGGHAAHFSNIDMPAPCFSQEFAPSSVAFAEVQSMFLDSLIGDADWLTRYAVNRQGEPMPQELIEKGINDKQPFAAWSLRCMLVVPYAERAIYEIPEEELTAENILQTIRRVESEVLGLPEGSPRPVLSIPHLLAGESSAYYHGYVLAEMGVAQTRAFFKKRDGHLVDNPKIGPDLKKHYWQPGNSIRFLPFIERLTGEPLSAKYLADKVNRSPQEAVAEAVAAIENLKNIPEFQDKVKLGADIHVVHGNETITTIGATDDFCKGADTFEKWIVSLG